MKPTIHGLMKSNPRRSLRRSLRVRWRRPKGPGRIGDAVVANSYLSP
jgi:hypothetical protein